MPSADKLALVLRECTSGVSRLHRGDGKHFVVRADEKLTAFMELECLIRVCGGTQAIRFRLVQPI
jgi:hypothetical protein